MTDIIDTVQLLDTEEALVELFDIVLLNHTEGVDANGDPLPGNYHLINMRDEVNAQVSFNGIDYFSIPIEITGIEIASSGAIARPTLTIANIPSLTGGGNPEETTLDSIRGANHLIDNTASGLNLEFERNEDLIGTKITYRQTFASNLNTAGTAEPEFPKQIYYIDRVASENNLFVTFELASPLDLEKAKIPARNVIGQYCPWRYQGQLEGLGGACFWGVTANEQHGLFTVDDERLPDASNIGTYNSNTTYNPGDLVKTEAGASGSSRLQIWQAVYKNAGKNPLYHLKYWKRADLCGKTLNSCKIRFQGYSKTIQSITPGATTTISFASESLFQVSEEVQIIFDINDNDYSNIFNEEYVTIASVSNSNPYSISLNVDTSSLAVDITAATQASPVVLTTDTHGFINSQAVSISGVVGMTELNSNTYYAKVVNTTTLELYEDVSLSTALDGQNFTQYTSGGVVSTAATFNGYVNRALNQTSVLPFGGFPGAKKFR